MNTLVFQPGMTWRKLGYGLYSDSMAYREVLDQNPKWSVTELPPVGTVLSSQTTPSLSGISQQSSVFGRPTGLSSLEYYPFESEGSYYSALSRYSRNSLAEVERLNGWTMDSSAASGVNEG